MLLAVMALILLVGQPLQARSLVSGILVTEWLLIAAPVLLLAALRPRSTRAAPCGLRSAGPAPVVGAALAGLSAWYLVGVLVERLQERILPMPPEMMRELQRALFGGGRPLARRSAGPGAVAGHLRGAALPRPAAAGELAGAARARCGARSTACSSACST